MWPCFVRNWSLQLSSLKQVLEWMWVWAVTPGGTVEHGSKGYNGLKGSLLSGGWWSWVPLAGSAGLHVIPSKSQEKWYIYLCRPVSHWLRAVPRCTDNLVHPPIGARWPMPALRQTVAGEGSQNHQVCVVGNSKCSRFVNGSPRDSATGNKEYSVEVLNPHFPWWVR